MEGECKECGAIYGEVCKCGSEANSELSAGLCTKCRGTGTIAGAWGGGEVTENNIILFHCSCEIGQQNADEQLEALSEHGA